MRTQQRGFTLIESLISLAILSGGLIATTKMQTNMMSGNRLAHQRGEAVNLARSRLEVLRHAGVCSAAAPTLATVSAQATAQYLVSVSCIDAKTPTVIVSWSDSSGAQPKVVAANGQTTADNNVTLSTTL